MKIKVMVDRVSYSRLSGVAKPNEGFWALALNDIVSSTRHDPNRIEHRYESRRTLCEAAIRAGGGSVGVLAYDDIHFGSPVRATLVEVSPGAERDGMRFMARFVGDVAGGPATAKPGKGGAR